VNGEPIAIPYEQQHGPRLCGPAALAMVYRSLGQPFAQEEIWPEVKGRNAMGQDCAFTHKLGAHARARGLDALVLQTRDPWAALARCTENPARAILNHRPTIQAMTGHFTVLVRMDGSSATVHDPQFGAARRLSKDELLELWSRNRASSYEITGNGLVVIGRPDQTAHSCRECGVPLAPSLDCAKCGKAVPLRPAGVLGCLEPGCRGNLWNKVFCPECDSVLWQAPGASPAVGMSPAGVFEALSAGGGPATITDVVNAMSDVLASARDKAGAPARETIDRFSAQLAQAREELAPALNELLQQGQQKVQALQAELAELEVKREKEKEARAAKKNKQPLAPPAAPPPAKPRRKVDPDLGKMLRQKLLDELGQAH
jgi:hypothetical protein